MATKTRKPTSRAEQRALLKLSPFEVKDKLMALAAETEREGQFPMLNARARQSELALHHPRAKRSAPCCASRSKRPAAT